VLDFPETQSALDQKRYGLSQANATSVMVLESGSRTRMVVNLVELVPFKRSVSGRQLTLLIGHGDGQSVVASPTTDILRSDANRVERVVSEITDLAFQRSPDGEGLLILSLTNPEVDASIYSEGGDMMLEFLATNVRESLIRRFDVTDFATPVQAIDVSTTERGTRLKLSADGLYDYLAYQTGSQYILAVAALSEEEKRDRLNEFDYVGDRISLSSILSPRIPSPGTSPYGCKMFLGIRRWIWCSKPVVLTAGRSGMC
jgi:type IV pilus assembly protein PilQ